MGYTTCYDLIVSNKRVTRKNARTNISKELDKEIAKKLAKTLFDSDELPYNYDNTDDYYPGEYIDSIVSEDSMKWYYHYSDMEELSKEYPDLYFLLHGEGEEENDEWLYLYHNGQEEMIFQKS